MSRFHVQKWGSLKAVVLNSDAWHYTFSEFGRELIRPNDGTSAAQVRSTLCADFGADTPYSSCQAT